jgi:chemotaxis protein CheD
VAVESLITTLISLGAVKNRLTAKLFGGACVIEALQNKEDHIGRVNAEFATSTLRIVGIPVVEHDLGGRRARKLVFNTDDGESWVRYL